MEKGNKNKEFKNGGMLIPKKQTAWGKLEKIDQKNLTPRQKMLLQRSQQARKNIEQSKQPKPEDNDRADQIRKEVQFVQNTMNNIAHSDKDLGIKYKKASDKQVQQRIDDMYPYKLMTKSVLTAGELASAGYFLAKGIGKGAKYGTKLIGTKKNRYGHPVFAGKWKDRYDKIEKMLQKWDKGQVTMNSIGFGADLGQTALGDNSWQNKTEIGLDTAGILGGTNVVRNSPFFGKYGKYIDGILDTGGYSAAGYDIYNYLTND